MCGGVKKVYAAIWPFSSARSVNVCVNKYKYMNIYVCT